MCACVVKERRRREEEREHTTQAARSPSGGAAACRQREAAAAAGEDSGVKMTRAATEEGPRGGAALFGLAGVYVHDVLAVVGRTLRGQAGVAHGRHHHGGCVRVAGQEHGLRRRPQLGHLGVAAHGAHVAHSHRRVATGQVLHAWWPNVHLWTAVHHVSHSTVRSIRRTCASYRPTRSIRLIDHWLHDSSPRVNEPVVDLEDGESGVLGQLLFLVFGGIRMREVLEEPGSHNVGGHLGEDAALLLALLASVLVFVLACAVARAHTGVAVRRESQAEGVHRFTRFAVVVSALL